MQKRVFAPTDIYLPEILVHTGDLGMRSGLLTMSSWKVEINAAV